MDQCAERKNLETGCCPFRKLSGLGSRIVTAELSHGPGRSFQPCIRSKCSRLFKSCCRLQAEAVRIELPDLINGGVLYPGMSLFPRLKKHSYKVATLLQDGQVEVDGVAYSRTMTGLSLFTGAAAVDGLRARRLTHSAQQQSISHWADLE
jgi:hypothetical protein